MSISDNSVQFFRQEPVLAFIRDNIASWDCSNVLRNVEVVNNQFFNSREGCFKSLIVDMIARESLVSLKEDLIIEKAINNPKSTLGSRVRETISTSHVLGENKEVFKLIASLAILSAGIEIMEETGENSVYTTILPSQAKRIFDKVLEVFPKQEMQELLADDLDYTSNESSNTTSPAFSASEESYTVKSPRSPNPFSSQYSHLSHKDALKMVAGY